MFKTKDSPIYTSEIEENSIKNIKSMYLNFNLMTFNPKNCKNSNGLDPILKIKCLSFTLPPNDNDYDSSS